MIKRFQLPSSNNLFPHKIRELIDVQTSGEENRNYSVEKMATSIDNGRPQAVKPQYSVLVLRTKVYLLIGVLSMA